MTIASAIVTKQQQVAAAYTECNNKGATMPGTQDLTNLANCIGTIPTGGGGSTTKYGANINTLLGDVDSNGVLQLPTEQTQLVFTGVTNVASFALRHKFAYTNVATVSFPSLTTIAGDYGVAYCFYNCSNLTTASFPSLTTISYNYGMGYCFYNCSNLITVTYPSLTTISGSYGMYNCLYGCSKLTTVTYPSLTTISGSYYVMGYCYYNCSNLTTVSFPKLNTITSNSCFNNAFSTCYKIADIYFNKVTTATFASVKNQFNNMFNSYTASTSGTVNVHFPRNLSSTVSGLTGYPTFGGNSSRVVLKFDLTATS